MDLEKKQRIRWELAAATRLNVAGSTERDDDLDLIEDKYNLSSAGVGGTRALGQYYSGGDYWN